MILVLLVDVNVGNSPPPRSPAYRLYEALAFMEVEFVYLRLPQAVQAAHDVVIASHVMVSLSPLWL